MKIFLIVTIVFSTIVTQAQTDIIYPAKGTVSIQGCLITDIVNGNVVFYVKNSIHDSIKATGIYRNGVYTVLSKDVSVTNNANSSPEQFWLDKTNYYYKDQYRKALSTRNVGIGLSLFGISTGIVGVFVLQKSDYYRDPPPFGAILYFSGAVITNIGVILWISGGVNASKHKKAAIKTKNMMNIALGTTINGIGLALNF